MSRIYTFWKMRQRLRSAAGGVWCTFSANAAPPHDHYTKPVILDRRRCLGSKRRRATLTGCWIRKRDLRVGFRFPLPKPFRADELLQCVQTALIRSAEQRLRSIEENEARRLLDLLTPREFQVLQLVVTGMLNKQSAGELGICLSTLKVHRTRAMRKLGITSIPELIPLMQKGGAARGFSRSGADSPRNQKRF
jgi:DNA-binding CsgD family transcriptional regulator